MIKYLAESDDHKLIAEDETVSLHFKDGSREPVFVGDFYGNPTCGLIGEDDRFVVTGGCGLIIYKLGEPFDLYSYTRPSGQIAEFFRGPENIWWIKCLYQHSMDYEPDWFYFLASNKEGTGLYKMNYLTSEIEKIPLSNE